MRAKILVIDDEESIRFTFERFLTSAGCNVITAGNCREAMERIDEGGFDLVFLDLILSDGNGIDLLMEIKSRGLTCPVIIMTAYPGVETRREALSVGAFDYIAKPVYQCKVMETISMALPHKKIAEQRRPPCRAERNKNNTVLALE
jgi:DNA-binding NtrC family response regulator